jgi:hypothetical protein
MSAIQNNSAIAALRSPTTAGLTGAGESSSLTSLQGKGKSNDELRNRFTQFVGEAFFGQMTKAMRSTVGKPAYFHGGRAEEVFQGQLDQTMAEHLTKTSASKFSEPMFDRQFPQLTANKPVSGLDELSQLRRQ